MNKKELATSIVEKVGGKDNIIYVTHCMTRLRFNLKDSKKTDTEGLKKMKDVVGVTDNGGQYQLIIGPKVPELFDEIALLLPKGLLETKSEEEPKEGYSLKRILNSIMDVIGSCITPMLPIITAAGLIKLVVSLLGPTMLNVMSETSDFMRLLTFVGDAGFYFFPMYVAYGGAKKFKTSVPLALFIAGIMLHPTLFQIVEAGKPFTVYGIPMTLTTYASNFIPMIFITWAMSYVEKGINKILPTFLRPMLFPLLMIAIMLPLALCLFGPIGSIVGNLLADLIINLHGVLGPVAIGLVAALWPLLIVTGMHQALIAIAITHIATQGFDASILVGAGVANNALIAISLAYLIKSKGAENKAYASSSFVTLALGGISEPVLFGVLLRYKKSIIYLLISGFIGGFYAGLMGVKYYFFGATNILGFLSFAGESSSSLLNGIIASIITFLIAFILCMLFGFGDKSGNDLAE